MLEIPVKFYTFDEAYKLALLKSDGMNLLVLHESLHSAVSPIEQREIKESFIAQKGFEYQCFFDGEWLYAYMPDVSRALLTAKQERNEPSCSTIE